MKIIHDMEKFDEIVKPIFDFEFSDYDIIPDSLVGDFFPNRLSELQEYCQKHPELHIISYLNDADVYANKPSSGAFRYRLATGIADPDIYYIHGYTLESVRRLKVSEFSNDKLPGKSHMFKRTL